MAKVGINTGSAANAGDGSALRAGANIINANFDEIYEYFGDGTTLDADLAGKWLAVATGINTLSNIGIGTTNPWNALTVLGNASITGVTTSSGGFSGDITGTVTGNVYNTGISTFQDVLVSGASTITGKSTFTGIGTFSSDLYVGGNLYTLGDITYDEVNGRNISVTGIGTVAYLGVTDLNVSGFSTFSGLSTTGSDLYIGDSLYVSQDATVLGVITASTFGATSAALVTVGGTERVHVTSDGYIGVGETPNTKVGVVLAAQVADGTDDGADWGGNGIFQLNASGTAAAGNEILLMGAHSGGLAQIASGIGFGRHNTSDWGTYLSFKTHPADTSNIDAVNERMRITSDGQVRVGSTAVTANTAGDDIIIEGASDRGLSIISGSSSSGNIYFGDSDDADIGRIMYNHNDNALEFYTNASGTSNAVITSDGRVRVGSTAVTAAVAGDDLVIEGASDRGISIISGSTSSGNIYFGDSSDADVGRIVYQHNDNAFDFHTNGSATIPSLRISSTAAVGVGTISPLSQLQVNTTKNVGVNTYDVTNYALGLRNHADDDGEKIGLSFAISSNSTKVGAAILHKRDAGGSQGGLEFYTSGDGSSITERVSIPASGGLTVTGSGSTVTVEGDIRMTGNNNFFNPPSLTTTERNNATTMTAGSMIWNETANRLEYYNGSAWRKISNQSV